jgi:hypothetical protein
MHRAVGMLMAMLVVTGCSAQPGAAAITVPPAPAATVAPADEPGTVPGQRPIPETASSYATISARTWALIVKDPDKYFGRGYKLWACITQFDAATGADVFRADASYRNEPNWYLANDNALFAGDEAKLADFVKGDVVALAVVDGGSYSYDTQIGGSTTVPIFRVVTIKRASDSSETCR